MRLLKTGFSLCIITIYSVLILCFVCCVVGFLPCMTRFANNN